jgi:hypothetical protein
MKWRRIVAEMLLAGGSLAAAACSGTSASVPSDASAPPVDATGLLPGVDATASDALDDTVFMPMLDTGPATCGSAEPCTCGGPDASAPVAAECAAELAAELACQDAGGLYYERNTLIYRLPDGGEDRVEPHCVAADGGLFALDAGGDAALGDGGAGDGGAADGGAADAPAD